VIVHVLILCGVIALALAIAFVVDIFGACSTAAGG
jgi:hypothetical protein